ncbi:MAG: nucleotidyltransferase family protein, partial [Spirochaetota bacterium]
MIKAIIMAGGEGTRLRPLTCNRAKPMTPVINKPVVEYAVELLRKHGITEIVISLFYLPENVQNYFGDGTEWDVNITYSVEENPLGTAGGVRLAAENFDDTFIVLSGDGIIDFNITKLIQFHKQHKSPFTIALARVHEPTEYGIVITDRDTGRIEKFLEKPSWSEVFSDTANTGMYVIEPDVIRKHVPANTKFDFSFDLFPLLQEKNLPLYGYIADGYWCDVGNIESYLLVHHDILDQLVDLEMPGKRITDNVWVGN